MKDRALALLVIFLLTVTLGCRASGDGQQHEDVTFELDAPFTVANGESAALQEGTLRITFDSVLRDGRCPRKLDCAGQGAVEILVIVEGGGQQAEEGGESRQSNFEMNPDPTLAEFGWAPTTVTFGAYVIDLRAVEPYPQRPEDLEREAFDDYEATFVVSESAGE